MKTPGPAVIHDHLARCGYNTEESSVGHGSRIFIRSDYLNRQASFGTYEELWQMWTDNAKLVLAIDNERRRYRKLLGSADELGRQAMVEDMWNYLHGRKTTAIHSFDAPPLLSLPKNWKTRYERACADYLDSGGWMDTIIRTHRKLDPDLDEKLQRISRRRPRARMLFTRMLAYACSHIKLVPRPSMMARSLPP